MSLPRPRSAVTALLALALAASVSTPSAQARDDLKDKQKHVQKSIDGAKADLDESSRAAKRAFVRLTRATTSLKTARADLRSSRSEVAKAKVVDARLKVELSAAQADLVTAREELAAGKARVKEQVRQIGEFAGSQAQTASPQLIRLSMLFSRTGAADTATTLQAADDLADEQANVLDDLEAAKKELARTETQVEDARDVVAEKKREAAANLTRKREAQRRAAEAEASVEQLVDQRRSAKNKAVAARKSDRKRLAELRRENDRITRMLIKRAQQHSGAGYQGSANGFLLRPVDGYVTSPYGWRTHPIYGYWGLHDGTDFHAPCGTPLRASADGVVVSKYFQSVWGNRLILDVGKVNGKGVAVIYNHLSRYAVGNGARVKRGEVVGYAGTTGWSTACHLHYSVMVNGKAVDPMGWF